MKVIACLLFCFTGLLLSAQNNFDILPLADGLYMHRTISNQFSADEVEKCNGLLVDAVSGYVLFNPSISLSNSRKIESWIEATGEKPIIMVILTRADTSLVKSADYFVRNGAIVSTTEEIAEWATNSMEFPPAGILTAGNYSIGELSFDIVPGNNYSFAVWIDKYKLLYGTETTEDFNVDNGTLQEQIDNLEIRVPYRGGPIY